MSNYDVIIIGAGAAGLMCARVATALDKNVLVIDHNEKPGRKIIISGGGRCNFTNLNATYENYLCKNQHFVKSALAQYTPYDFLDMVGKYKIKYFDKQYGALFCQNSSQEILNMLLQECSKAKFQMNCKTSKIIKSDCFEVATNLGNFKANSLVVATGGLSIAKLGATGFGYDIARQFNLKVIPPKPALDGFKLNKDDLKYFYDLAGVSSNIFISIKHKIYKEPILFTHQGLSGPASLKASLYFDEADIIKINWLPDFSLNDSFYDTNNLNIKLENFLNLHLPKRLI